MVVIPRQKRADHGHGRYRGFRRSSARLLMRSARDIERLEALRSINDLQRNYAQLGQFGRWEAMASLFAEHGELYCGEAC